MRRLRLIVALALAAIPLGYAAILATGVWRSGLTWREMDLDKDGTTSLGELFLVADTGRRDVVVDGQHCTEIFLLKDGLPVKVHCPAS